MFFFSPQCQVNAETGDPEDELTPDAVEFCRRLGSNSTRVSDIAGGQDRAVNAAIQDGINRVNEKSTSNAQRIQKWTILDQDFSVTGGELGEWGGGKAACAALYSLRRVGIVCVYIQNKVSNSMTDLFHRPYNEAEAAGGGEDVQGAD